MSLSTIAAASIAVLAPGASTAEAAEEPKNRVSVKGAAIRLFLDEESGASSTDDLVGVSLSYERVLVPDALVLELSKPFYFGRNGRFDSPFDVLLELTRRFGPVEPFVGAGVTFNLRVFDPDREAAEGRRYEPTLGVITSAGGVFWIAERWALELEVAYAYLPVSRSVRHEVSAAFGPVFAF